MAAWLADGSDVAGELVVPPHATTIATSSGSSQKARGRIAIRTIMHEVAARERPQTIRDGATHAAPMKTLDRARLETLHAAERGEHARAVHGAEGDADEVRPEVAQLRLGALRARGMMAS